jgi:ribose transport system substrate-binding protein
MIRRFRIVVFVLLLVLTIAVPVGAGAQDKPRWEDEIVIGWTPPDITGVFKTATDFFEKSADDANENGFNVTIIPSRPARGVRHQVAMVGLFSAKWMIAFAGESVIVPALKKANEEGIPVIIVNCWSRLRCGGRVIHRL